ncbi:MAG: crossover junction endodeoxyribonuclease RuvC [Planctomycetota bacterium]
MRVLGIDPGTSRTGWGLVEQRGNRLAALDYGAISIPRDKPFCEKLVQLYGELAGVLRRARPDAAAIEDVFYGQNVRTALVMGQARGAAMLAVAHAGVALYEYEPARVKKAVVGNGRAHKVQVQEMVRVLLGLAQVPEPDDAADALALAICHCHRAEEAVPVRLRVRR